MRNYREYVPPSALPGRGNILVLGLECVRINFFKCSPAAQHVMDTRGRIYGFLAAHLAGLLRLHHHFSRLDYNLAVALPGPPNRFHADTLLQSPALFGTAA